MNSVLLQACKNADIHDQFNQNLYKIDLSYIPSKELSCIHYTQEVANFNFFPRPSACRLGQCGQGFFFSRKVFLFLAMSGQIRASGLSVDAHKIYKGPKVKYVVKEKFRDMAACLHEIEHEKKLHKFGIVGVVPPDDACPPLFDVLNEGARGLKHLREVTGITEHAQQRLYRFARHLVAVENDFVFGSMTFEEFMWKAKKEGIFEPISRDIEEAIQLWWDRHAEVMDKEGVSPKPKGTLYPFTIEGSIYKTMRGLHEVSNALHL